LFTKDILEKFYVYILQSLTSNSYYIGQTNDLERRFLYHNSGYSKSTKGEIPWRIVYQQEFMNRAEAMKRETQLTSYKNKLYLEKIIKNQKRPDGYREGQRFDPA
jgi:putative endonuclease